METLNIGKYTFQVRDGGDNHKFILSLDDETYPFYLNKIDSYLEINLRKFCEKHVGYYYERVFLEAKNMRDLKLLCTELSILIDIKENQNLNLHKTIKNILKEYGTIL